MCFSGAISAISVCVFFLLIRSDSVASAPEQIIVAEYDTIDVPVPIQTVPSGTKFEDIVFEKIKLPQHQLPEGILTDISSLRGQISISRLPARLPLFAANFSPLGSTTNPVIEGIPDGMRAMTIKVDATSAVEGWAGSGAIVDVLLIEKDQTTVVAENIKILSAERSVAPVEGQASPNVPSTVTLLVSQEQCLAINTAIPRGKIAFALRNFVDQNNWEEKVFTSEKLSRYRGESQQRNSVSGYVEIKGKGKFILSEDKWLKTPEKPAGFFVGDNEK